MNKIYFRFPDFKLKALTLSYDDGGRQDKRLIKIMKKHGLKGTFNLNSGFLEDSYKGVEKGCVSVQEALDLYIPSGMEVAVHGYKHLALSLVDSAMAVNDVVMDRKELERIFGKIIKGTAYAFGANDENTTKILKQCGFSYARTGSISGNMDLPTDWLNFCATCHHKDPKLMEYAKKFVELKEDPYFWRNRAKLFSVKGHSYEFDNDNNWHVIEQFAEYVGNRDDVWYATNGEIFEYVQACDRLEWGIDGNLVHNPSSIEVYIDFMGKKLCISGGATVEVK